MDILILCLINIILGVSSGIFSFFLDFCFREGNIFDFYYDFIYNKYFLTEKYKLFKVFGGCNICFNIWISSFLFIGYLAILEIPIFLYILYISSSFLISFFLNNLEK